MLNIVNIPVELLDHFDDLNLPVYKTPLSSGLDLSSAEDCILVKGERRLVATGIKIAVPAGYEAQVRPRSGLTLKHGILIPNSPGTIDADYRGEIKIIMWNLGEQDFEIKRGDRIAQLIIVPVVKAEFQVVEQLDNTIRSDGGFGSTGTK